MSSQIPLPEVLLAVARSGARGLLDAGPLAIGVVLLLSVVAVGLVARRINSLMQNLNESEARTRAILESAVDGIITIDHTGTVDSFNPAAEGIFGYAASEVLGKNVKMLMNRYDESRHDGYIHHYLTTGEKKIIGQGREVVGRRKDGTTFAMDLGVSEFNVAGRRSFVGIIRDVTDRKETSEELRRASARLTLAVQAANVGIWDYNVVTNELIWDDAMYALYGISEDTFSGAYEAWENGLHPDDLARAARELQEALSGGEEFDTEFRVVWPDSSCHHIKAAALVQRDDEGNPLRMIGTNWDITERVLSAEELTRAKERAEASSRSKSEFLASMSHELRTPLNAIIGFSEVLLDGSFGPLNDRQKRYTGNVLNSGRHLLLLINDILDLSKVEAGKMELGLATVEVATLLRDSLSMVKEIATRAQVELSTDIDEEIEGLRITADERKLKQVMFNLLSNAVKFTTEGGEVKLSARLDQQQLLIAVSDTGIGIKPEDQRRIFNEFEQVDSSLSRQHDGTGLGLALVREFLALHKGRVWVESEGVAGAGSTFWVALPISEDPGSLTVDRGNEALVLVVEGCPQAGELLSVHLLRGGYRVALASNSEEALKLAQELQPAAVTLDIALGAREGFLLLAELKAHEQTRSIPVILVSTVEERKLAIRLGATDYLVKPVDRDKLIRAISRALGGKDSTKTVLIVDDEPEVLELLSGILSSEGLRVVEASDGQAALNSVAAELPDAVVLDLMMPQLDGFEVLELLRADPRSAGVPVIIYTAKDLTNKERLRLKSGAQAVISKAGTQDLIEAISRALDDS